MGENWMRWCGHSEVARKTTANVQMLISHPPSDSREVHSQAFQQAPCPVPGCQHKASLGPERHQLALLDSVAWSVFDNFITSWEQPFSAHKENQTTKTKPTNKKPQTHTHDQPPPSPPPPKIYLEIFTEFHKDHTSALCHRANSGPLASVWHMENHTPDVPILLHKHQWPTSADFPKLWGTFSWVSWDLTLSYRWFHR